MHGLATLTEQFLVAQRLRNNQFEKKKLLVTELGERNVYGLFEKGTKELIRGLEELPYRDVNFYKEVHELNLNFYGHFQTNKQKGNTSILRSAIQNLEYYFLSQRQRLDFIVKSHEKLIGDKFDVKSYTEAKKILSDEPIFKIYELVIEALSNSDNDVIYLKIETMFKNEISRLAKHDQFEIIGILLNHFNDNANKRKEGYQSKMLSLYKFGLDQNLMLENNQIDETIFTNIASVGIAEGEFDWVEGFIEEYKMLLPSSVRDEATSLSLGLLFFYKKEFTKTIELILNRKFSKPLDVLKSKSILLRVYFEQFLLDDSYYSFLIDQTNAFEKFVRRNDLISESKKEAYLNFILFTRRLANSFFQNASVVNLYDKVRQTELVVLKGWLIAKMGNME